MIAERLKRARQWLAEVFVPLGVIASELKRMNDLKELELTERLNPKSGERDPVFIITEQPGKGGDTEIFFGSDVEAHGTEGMRQKLSKLWASQSDDE